MKNRIVFGLILAIVFSTFSCSRKETSTDEHFCPQLHFSTGKNWTGEPAGLLYYEGEYHLFFQHNPDQPVLGNIHWGHAVSRDLLHWEVLPIAIYPDQSGQIYPGSVIADQHNTSGLGSAEDQALIAFYTYYNTDQTKKPGQVVALAYSNDKGRSWKKQDKPVLISDNETIFRNPHVSWNEMTGQWLMTVSIGSSLRFYTSPDCLTWSLLSEFGNTLHSEGGWESSNLFPLPVMDSDSVKWVLTVSMNGGPAGGAPGIRYFVGDFDGKEFKPTQTQELWADYGKDNYAGMTCNNAPDNRRLMLGWMNSWDYANLTPTNTWRGSLTLPRELKLMPESKYYLLTSAPIKELRALTGRTDSVKDIKLSEKKTIFSTAPFPKAPFALQFVFDNSNRHAIWTAQDYGIRLKTRSGKSISIGYRADMNYYYIDRSNLMKQSFSESYEQLTGATYTSQAPTSDWYILVDHSSVELFACGNRIAMTALCFPDEAFESVELYAESGTITLLKASITELNTLK